MVADEVGHQVSLCAETESDHGGEEQSKADVIGLHVLDELGDVLPRAWIFRDQNSRIFAQKGNGGKLFPFEYRGSPEKDIHLGVIRKKRKPQQQRVSIRAADGHGLCSQRPSRSTLVDYDHRLFE